MYAALHGELTPHPWRGAAPDSDAYGLFVARSAAMGWLAEAREGTGGGVWGMNDAGYTAASGPRPTRVAWFQAVLAEDVPPDRPLPLQPFLTCAGDVTARLGALRPTRRASSQVREGGGVEVARIGGQVAGDPSGDRGQFTHPGAQATVDRERVGGP